MRRLLLILVIFFLLAGCKARESINKESPVTYQAGYQVLEIPVQNRTVTTALWYPTDASPSVYFYGGEQDNNQGQVAVNAPLAGKDDKTFPLFLYSHGFGGCALGSSYLGESLAGKGWIVAAPDHTDTINICRTGAGHLSDDAWSLQREAQKLVASGAAFDFDRYAYRPRDLNAVLEHLLSLEEFSSRILEDQMAVGGHSFGGYTSLAISGGLEDFSHHRFQAVVLHSPGIWLYNPAHFEKIESPVLYMLGEQEADNRRLDKTKLEWAHLLLDHIHAPGYYQEVANGNHFSFNTSQRDGILSGLLSGSSQELSVIRRQTTAFLELHVRDREESNQLLPDGAGISTYWTNSNVDEQSGRKR